MKTVDMNLNMQRAEIIRQLFATDSPEVIKKVQRTLSNAIKSLHNEKKEEERDTISQSEIVRLVAEAKAATEI